MINMLEIVAIAIAVYSLILAIGYVAFIRKNKTRKPQRKRYPEDHSILRELGWSEEDIRDYLGDND